MIITKYITRLSVFYILTATLLCCTVLFAHAQRKEFELKGVVLKNGSAQRLSKVLVANLKNFAIVTTDDLGIFTIKCALGDTILFRQKDFSDKKMAVIITSVMMVYMDANITLSEVNIKGQSRRQELQEVMGEYNSQGVYANGKPSVASAILSPLNGLYSLFGSGPKQARRFKEYSANELEQIEVDKRYTRALVTKVTGLQDTKLTDFMNEFRPSYTDIKQWNQYELIQYIKKNYDYFEKNGQKVSEKPSFLLRKDTAKVSLGTPPKP